MKTIYIGREDRSKPTLLLTHGNWSMALGEFRRFKAFSEHWHPSALNREASVFACLTTPSSKA